MDNVYKAPEAELVQLPRSEFGRPFFITSISKLCLLYMFSFGLYALYWGYKQWDSQRFAVGKKIWPIWRTLFLLFYTHSLSRLIAVRLDQQQQPAWRYNGTAICYVVMWLVSLAAFFYPGGLLPPLAELFVWLALLVGSVLPLVAIQRRANLASLDPQGQSNSSYSAFNWLFMVIGAVIWALAILGYVMLALGLVPES